MAIISGHYSVDRPGGDMTVNIIPSPKTGGFSFTVNFGKRALQKGDFTSVPCAALIDRVDLDPLQKNNAILRIFQDCYAPPLVRLHMLISQYYTLKDNPTPETTAKMKFRLKEVFSHLAALMLQSPLDRSLYAMMRPDELAQFFVYLIIENPSRDEPYQALAAAEPNVIKLTMECLPQRFHELSLKGIVSEISFLKKIQEVFPTQPPEDISSFIEIYLGLSLLHGMLSPLQYPITKEPGKQISSTIRHVYSLLISYGELLDTRNAGGQQLSAADKASLHQLNTTVALERALLYSLNKVKRGAAYWKKHVGEVGEEPPLPFFASRLFAGVCHLTNIPMLYYKVLLIPTTLNGAAVTPKNKGQTTPVMLAHKDEDFIAPFLKVEEHPHWAVLINLPCNGAWQKRVEELPSPYRLPTLWEAVAANLVEHKTPQIRMTLCREARSGRVATLSTETEVPYRYHTAPAIPRTKYKEVTVVLELNDNNVAMLTH